MQAKPTKNTLDIFKHILDYVASNPIATLRYQSSQMILHIDTYAAYLVLPKAQSRIAAYYYLSNNLPTATDDSLPLNASITVYCKTVRKVITSAEES